MEPNAHSHHPADERPPAEAIDVRGTGREGLAAALDELATRDVDGMPYEVLVEETQVLERLLGRLELQWLRELAEVDALGAAGADQGTRAPSTASWLQARLGMSAAEANSHVQTAGVLFGSRSRQPPPR